MSRVFRRSILAALTLAVAGLAMPTEATAQQLQWPRSTALPRPAKEPAPPPANLERAPSITAFKAKEAERAAAAKRCPPGRACVVCVAACDTASPVVVQTMTPQPTHGIANTGAENDSDGVAANAPRFARQEWAGITCGSESGCRGAGTAPSRHEVDIRLSVFGPYSYSSSSSYRSPSRYIDR